MTWEGSDRRKFLPADWDKIRKRIFKRDGYRCVARMLDGSRCPAPAEECDHKGSRYDHSDGNLQSLCHWHHKNKTAQEAEASRAKRREKIHNRFRRNERHPGSLK